MTLVLLKKTFALLTLRCDDLQMNFPGMVLMLTGVNAHCNSVCLRGLKACGVT